MPNLFRIADIGGAAVATRVMVLVKRVLLLSRS